MTVTLLCPECEGKLWRRRRCNTESCDRYQDRIDDPVVDSDGIVTVGDLREEIDGLPDDALISVTASGAWNFAYTVERDSLKEADVPVLSLSEHRPLFD